MKSGDLAQAVRASAAVPAALRARAARRAVPGRRRPLGQHSGGRGAGRGRRAASSSSTRPSTRSDSIDAYSPLLVADRLVQFLFQQRPDSLAPRRPARPARRRRLHQPQLLPPQHRAPARPRGRARPTPRRCPVSPAAAPRCLLARARFPRGSPASRMRGANASERLALTRLLGARRRARATRSTSSCSGSGSAPLPPPPKRTSRCGSRPPARATRSTLDLVIRRAARRVAGLGLAYDNELGGRMWAGIVDRRLFGRALEGSGACSSASSAASSRSACAGTSRSAASSSIRRSRCGWPTRTSAGSTPTARSSGRPSRREASASPGVERPLAHGWELALGAEGRAWDEPGRADRSRPWAAWPGSPARPGSADACFEAEVAVDRGLSAGGARGHGCNAGSASCGSCRGSGWAGATGCRCSSASRSAGTTGFPGYHLGERRGDREAMLGVLFTVPLKGPLLARIEFAGGGTGAGAPLRGRRLDRRAYASGSARRRRSGRCGSSMALALRGRDALFVRLGRWF